MKDERTAVHLGYSPATEGTLKILFRTTYPYLDAKEYSGGSRMDALPYLALVSHYDTHDRRDMDIDHQPCTGKGFRIQNTLYAGPSLDALLPSRTSGAMGDSANLRRHHPRTSPKIAFGYC